MSIDFDYPIFLSPEQLDAVLEKGWFRMHESVFTTHFYMREGKLLSTVWLRSVLGSYKFSKNQRKRLRSIYRDCDIHFSPLRLCSEHEDLYQKYMSIAKGKRAESIANILGDASELVFQTWQLEVRSEGRLIAYSIFDAGRNSLQSILGIYDPDHSQESLGVMTMLLEVDYAIKKGFQLYYIGYFTPNCNAFDYKLRLGSLEFFNPDTGQWYPISFLKEGDLWSSIHGRKLEEAKDWLMDHGVTSRIFLNQHYDTVILNALGDLYLDEPLALDIRLKPDDRMGYLCHYSIYTEEYSLFLVDFEARRRLEVPLVEDTEHFPIYTSLIRKTHLVARGRTPHQVFSTVQFS